MSKSPPQRPSEAPSTASLEASEYPVPQGRHRVEEVIQRSRFITTVERAQSPEEAHAFVNAMRLEFPDATHNCWAFVAGPPGSSASVGMSDDGEPHGSAGRPMLLTLSHGEVGEIVAVCTRYYGGTKLGTGGLARAYSGGVALALEALPTVLKVDKAEVVITVPYPSVDAVERLLERERVEIIDRIYGDEIRYVCSLAVKEFAQMERAVQELTRGEAKLHRTD